MTTRQLVEALLSLGLGLAFLWLIWRSLRTGMSAGTGRMSPRRAEQPVRFWAMVLLYAAMAAWLVGQGVGRIFAAS